MSKKFVSDREIAFIEGISRELHQRVVVEEAYYYAIRRDLSQVDDLYNESIKKVWAAPVKVNVRFLYDNLATKAGTMGLDSQFTGEAYFHTKELQDRNIVPTEGDFIEYGEMYYEITSVSQPQLIFGQINNRILTKCTLVPSREGQFQAGADSARAIDHSHPVENATAVPRQSPIVADPITPLPPPPALFPYVKFGSAAVPGVYDSTFIQSLSDRTYTNGLSGIGRMPFNISIGQHGFFSFPTSFGAVGGDFIDLETGFSAAVSLVANTSVLDPDGNIVPFDIWRTNQPGLGIVTFFVRVI